MSKPVNALSTSDWLKITFQCLLLIPLVSWDLIYKARYSLKAHWPLKRSIVVSFSRQRNNAVSTRYQSALEPPTQEAVTRFCAEAKLDVKCISIRPSVGNFPETSLYEIPVPDQPDAISATQALLYIHGGGFASPLNRAAHMPLALACAKAARCAKVFILEYTLTPTGRYPTQLAQAAAAVNYILVTSKTPADELVLAGDSAGGNLVLGILAHVKQPMPTIDPIHLGATQFRAVLAISPWVSMSTKAASYTEVGPIDYLTKAEVEMLMEDFRPEKDAVWVDLLSGREESWGRDLAARNILLTAGSWEIFRDDIVELAGVMGAVQDGAGKVQLWMGENEVHAMPVIDVALKTDKTGSVPHILGWLKSL